MAQWNLSSTSSLKLMLSDEYENLCDSVAGELPVVEHFQHQVQFNLLRTLYALDQGYHRLVVRRSPQVEVVPGCGWDSCWGPGIYEIQVELDGGHGHSGSPHGEQVQLTGGGYPYAGHEGDVVVGERLWLVETIGIVEVAILDCLFAAIPVVFISDIIRRADNAVALIASSCVEANFFVSTTNTLFLAFVNILASSFVRGESVPGRTRAREGSRLVHAEPDAEVAMSLVGLAFVDVLAGSVVCTQCEPWLTRTLVRTPHIVADLLANVRGLGTLINVIAVLVVIRFAEPLLAVADIGALRVDALRHPGADLAAEPRTLVNVFTLHE